jgi:hypothetical protein
LALLREGKRPIDVAAAVGVSDRTIRRWRTEAGKPRRRLTEQPLGKIFQRDSSRPAVLRCRCLGRKLSARGPKPAPEVAQAMPHQPGSQVKLHGTWLWAAWLAWGAMAGMSLAIMVAGLPVSLQALRQPCIEATCDLPGVSLSAAGHQALHQIGLTSDTFAGIILGGGALTTLGFFAMAALIVWRKADSAMTLFVSLFLIVWGTEISSQHREALLVLQPGWHWPVAISVAYVNVSLFFFLFLFPNGRFVPGWMRLLALPLALPLLMGSLAPESVFNINTWPAAAAIVFIVLALGSGLGAQIYRYRRVSSSVERQQTKWVVAGLALMLPIAFAAFLHNSYVVRGMDQADPRAALLLLADSAIATLALLLLPISMAISILRYRLWDIDLIIRRTLSYGLLTGTLALVYFSVVVVLQIGLRLVTSQEQSLLATVLSTLAIAALFAPVRRRVQAAVDRRFFRRKYDAARTLAAFGTALRDEVDLGRLTEQLVQVVDDTMQPQHVGLWLRAPDANR